MRRGVSSHLTVNHRLTTAWLDRVWDAGLELVELFCARQSLDYRNPAQINELAHWFRDSELELHSLHAPMYSDDCWGRSGPGAQVNIADPEKIRRRDSVDEIKRALTIAESIPVRYLIQHVGVSGEEYDDRKLDAAFNSLEELNVFARDRGVEVLVENIPNRLSSAERLLYLLSVTHLDNGFCFDTGHAHLMASIPSEFRQMRDRIRSTHVHDNDGIADTHLFPFGTPSGTIHWPQTMRLLRSREGQYPLILEVREVADLDHPMSAVLQSLERLEAAGKDEGEEEPKRP